MYIHILGFRVEGVGTSLPKRKTQDVLGGDFKYDLGLLGDCYLDLFFLMVTSRSYRKTVLYIERLFLYTERQCP